MAWSLVVGQIASASVGSGTSIAVTLPNNPTAGNLVVIAVGGNFGGSGSTITALYDNNSNPYTITPSSPSSYSTLSGQVWLAYYNVPSSGGSRIVNVVFANTIVGVTVCVAEFAGGWGTLDGDNTGNGVGTNINTPTITVTGSNELLFTGVAFENTITSVNSPFTTADVTIGSGYALSISANTAVACTGDSSGDWRSMGMSFKLSPYISAQPVSQRVYVGQTATFNITAVTSGGTLHYQWKDDGGNVGTDSSSYTTSEVVLGDNGSLITCVVTDDNGSFTSNIAYLNVMGAGVLAWRVA